MRFKTHSSNIGDLMFQEFDSLDTLMAALMAHRDELPLTEVVIFHEDETTRSGWNFLTMSTHIIDFVEPIDPNSGHQAGGSWTSDSTSEISDALDRGAFVRWLLFCDDDPLDQCLDMVIPIHGTNCRCPAHRGAL
jgi:hypothetical protein